MKHWIILEKEEGIWRADNFEMKGSTTPSFPIIGPKEIAYFFTQSHTKLNSLPSHTGILLSVEPEVTKHGSHF